MGNTVILGVLGKLYNLQELRMTDKGGLVLDKSESDLISSYRCGFWPLFECSINTADIMVRGGMMVEPHDHGKIDIICSEHSGEQVIAEVEEDSDHPSIN